MPRQKNDSLPLPPLDPARYEGHETWTNKRWAWEFLLRNAGFRAACDGLDEDATPQKKRAIARKFGLAEFKHYDEPFKSGNGEPTEPMFISKAVSTIRPQRQRDGRWTRPVTIQPGQLALRFDLRLALADDRILDAQVETARKILEKQLDQWRKAEEIVPKKGRQRPMPRLLLQLKILDARTQAGTLAEQAALVWGPGAPAKRLTDSLDDAMNVATNDYLLLAAMGDDRPPRK
ncbi:hypothetical protein KEC55_01045 [Burkholderia cepacia]|uniref:transcriptional regulator domain-containing protein n=1 Tax=Burkholderia cepacia TaxID=292 RepID=UPI00249E8A2A|nr:DUF6499 domain-containing protein [Burkholderia cepacia]WGY68619.1 hypothetical protein KEC55_01045 [Burkholderia cepacia]